MGKGLTNLKSWLIFNLAPWLYRFYMGLVYLTSSKTHIGFKRLEDDLDRGTKIIAALWHQDIILAPYVYRDRGIITIASRSRDGEVITRLIEGLGFRVVRGSSSRGGIGAVKEMISCLARDDVQIAAITVDGPRGPARKVKPGVIFLAMKSGARIYPIRCSGKRNIYLNNWDRTLIPLPFNHLIFNCGKALTVSADLDRKGLQNIKKQLEFNLDEISRDLFID